jgi:hypothetical protein
VAQRIKVCLWILLVFLCSTILGNPPLDELRRLAKMEDSCAGGPEGFIADFTLRGLWSEDIKPEFSFHIPHHLQTTQGQDYHGRESR